MTKLLITTLTLFASLPAFARDINITCNAIGLLPNGGGARTLFRGEFQADSSQIAGKPKEGEGCVPQEIRSPVIGNVKGTFIEVTASKCGSEVTYFTFSVHTPEMPVITSFIPSEGTRSGRVVFGVEIPAEGEDPTELNLPEGRFSAVYFNCLHK